MTDIWIVFAIIAAVIVLFVWDRLPVIAVCVGCALALWATGVLTLNQSLAGFGDPGDGLRHLALRGRARALEKTGLTAWTGQVLIRGAGDSRCRLIVLMMLFVGVLSALISVNGAVAALLPVVVVLAVRLKRPPSQLLMPLVFGAHCRLDAGADRHAGERAGARGFARRRARGLRLFRVRLVGVSWSIGTIADRGRCSGARLLPVRESRTLPPDLSAPCAHARRAVPPRRRRAAAAGAARDRRWSGRPRAELDLAAAGRRPSSPCAGRRRRRSAARRDRGGRPARWCGATAEAVAALARRSTSRCCDPADAGPIEDVPLQPRLGPRRGAGPAALAADRRPPFPGHGHAERRSRGAGGAAPGRGPASAAAARRRATRCCCRAPGTRSNGIWRRRRCWW